MCIIQGHPCMEQLLQENKMSYHTPNIEQVVQKTPDPLINLGETSEEMKNQRNKRGFLSTFLQGSRNRQAGILGSLIGNQKQSLGSSNV